MKNSDNFISIGSNDPNNSLRNYLELILQEKDKSIIDPILELLESRSIVRIVSEDYDLENNEGKLCDKLSGEYEQLFNAYGIMINDHKEFLTLHEYNPICSYYYFMLDKIKL
jgi:hypothetical protein